ADFQLLMKMPTLARPGPVAMLPEIRLPSPERFPLASSELMPPTVLPEAPFIKETPDQTPPRPLVIPAVPVTLVPMKLPWMKLPVDCSTRTPDFEFPEITLPAPWSLPVAALTELEPPMVLLDAPPVMATPLSALASADVPEESVPM